MEYDLKNLTQKEVGLIFASLGEMPGKISRLLMNKIEEQVKEQDAAKATTLDKLPPA